MGPLADRPDASIVAAVLTGNVDAYGVLVARYTGFTMTRSKT